MITARHPASLNFTAPLVLDPPRHCGLSSIALAPGRHWIGTAAGCGIRVQVDGIMERHAMILVGENRTIVKSLDSHTWVNDSAVSEMALRPGDRLSIGPLTFRVRLATLDEEPAFAVTPKWEADHDDDAEPIPNLSVQEASFPEQAAPPAVVSQDRPGVSDGFLENSDVKQELADSIISTSPLQDSVRLDSRLDEIEQRLAELCQSTLSIVRPDEPQPARFEANPQTPQPLQKRHEELQRRAEEIAAETRRLQERTERVAEREAQVERRQQQLVLEGERIASAAETARHSLAEDHAQHISIWQDWEASYQKMMGELAAQMNAIDRQRQSLQADADRLALAQTEMQRAHAELERDRQVCVMDRVKLANDRTEFASLKSQHDVQVWHLRKEADSRQAQFEADRRELALREAALSTSREELERERQSLQADLSTHTARIEHENQQSTALKTQLEDDRKRLLQEREELRLQAEIRTRLEEDVAAAVEESPRPDQEAWNSSASTKICLPSPDTSYPDQSGEFGVAVDWSALAAVDREFGRASVMKPAENFMAEYEPAVRSQWSDALGPSDYTSAASPGLQASTLEVAQTLDDPWARYSPAGAESSGLASGISGFASEFATQEDDRPVEASQDYSPHATLAEVNREFGVPIDEPFSSQMAADSLPSWWLENPQEMPAREQRAEAAHPDWVVEALNSGTAEPQDQEADPPATAGPANDLRAQLAMLFDLPGTAVSETTAPVPIEEFREPEETPQDVSRESCSQIGATSAKAGSSSLAEATSEDSEPGVEDSVESFMAKLLARSRTSGSEMATPDSQRAASQSAIPVAASATEIVASIPSPQDRSHLMAEPKHKQDKQAVRENLQSFRNVAHRSARSALARHSMRQLRNATTAKGLLLGAATVSAVWFFAESPLQLWKAVGCSLAALLSAMEFVRSWKQLHKPLEDAAPANAAATQVLPTSDQSITPPEVRPLGGQQ